MSIEYRQIPPNVAATVALLLPGADTSTRGFFCEEDAVLVWSQRADERTRTADLISLRVIHQALQEGAQGCKSRIPKRLSLLRVAACCTVMRSRWCQSGVNRSPMVSRGTPLFMVFGLSTPIDESRRAGCVPPSPLHVL